MSATPALRLHGIRKRFGSLLANDDISLDLARGEVLALLGENGAGKSTLVSILFGHYVADAGYIQVDGHRLPPGQPKAALAAGIGMVHQHFTLADNLSVLDNVMLGTEPLWRLNSRRAQAQRDLQAAAQRFGLAVDPQARVGTLSVGERQRVEILKALVRGARILILDEPTAVLTPQESEQLFRTLAEMVAQGLSIVFISHKLGEVLRVSHRIAVLRAGRLVATMPTADADPARLAEAMVGRRVEPAQRRAGAAPGAVVCELSGASVAGRLHDLDLTLRSGEVVAVAGVSGNGQATLAQVLCGQTALDRGQLRLLGQPLPPRPRAFIDAGVARVPEDRHGIGTVGELGLWENAILEHYHWPSFSRLGWLGLLRRRAARAHARALVERFDVRGAQAQGVNTPARQLSGGNLQKLILGRALAPPPRQPRPADPLTAAGTTPPPAPLIVANQPTWGLDVGAVAAVHQRLLDAAAGGSAVLLISEDLDEVLALGDRVAVMHRGRLGVARPAAEWTLQDLGLAMAGAAPPAPTHSADARHAAA